MNLTDITEALLPSEETVSTIPWNQISGDLLFHLALLFLAGALSIPAILKVANQLLGKSKKLAPIQSYVTSSLRVSLWFLLILIVADAAGVPITSIITLLGVAGLAVSLALQNTLSNLAGGLQVLVSKPFVVGDYVDTDQGSGTVNEIGLAYSTLTSFDNKEIIIPNHLLASSKIVNHTASGVRRVDIIFPASYDAPTQKVREAILFAAAEIPQIHQDPPTVVCLSAFGDSAISYTLRAWTQAEDYWTVYYALMEGVRESFSTHGIEIPYQKINVQLTSVSTSPQEESKSG